MAIGKPKQVCVKCRKPTVFLSARGQWDINKAQVVNVEIDKQCDAYCSTCDASTTVITAISHHDEGVKPFIDTYIATGDHCEGVIITRRPTFYST